MKTSREGEIWDSDARYSYYAHGPLKRAEYGEDSLQGIDYTYTLQGWLKGVNHPQRTISSVGSFRGLDPGGDSLDAHPNYAPDAFGMALRYYQGDFYRALSPFHSDEAATPTGAEVLNLPAWDPGTGPRDLYNGNISSWTSNTVAGPSGGGNPVLIDQTLTGFTYEYDVLNRIRRSRYHRWNGTSVASQGNPYFSSYTYDPNGNIQTLIRRDSIGSLLDKFTYTYPSTSSNRLSQVIDLAGPTPTVGDLEPGQGTTNYAYDASGNLIGDTQEGISSGGIEWRADGKVWRVTKTNAAPDELKFSYNASGDRVIKKVSDNGVERRLYYVREAGGKVLAVYEQVCEEPYVNEFDPALDSDNDGIPDATDKCPCTEIPDQTDSDGDGFGDLCDPFPGVPATLNPATKPDSDNDGVPDDHDNCPCTPNPGQEDSNNNNVGDACDRGCEMVLIELHIYGNGSEGRIAISQPSGITRSGLRGDTAALEDLTIQPPPPTPIYLRDSIFTRVLDEKVYELKDHLGNVRVVISDVKAPASQAGEAPFAVTLRRYTNYYPFGMAQPGRSYEAVAGGEYRYGFQGHEGEPQVLNSENSIYDFDVRLYDVRIARFITSDPLAASYPSGSPFEGFNSNPLYYADPSGMSGEGTIENTSTNGAELVVRQHYVYYGGDANEQSAKAEVAAIMKEWNGTGYSHNFGGTESYKVRLEITYEVVSEKRALEIAAANVGANADGKINFIRREATIPSNIPGAQPGDLGTAYSSGNSAIIPTSDNPIQNKTGAHETGHLLGIQGEPSANLLGQGQPGVMAPKGATVDPQYQYNPSAAPGDGANGGTVDPAKRTGTAADWQAVLQGATLTPDGHVYLGTINNKVLDSNGRPLN